MHGTVFPPIESGEILSTYLFLIILLGAVFALIVLNRTIPSLVNDSFLKGFVTLSGVLTAWELISFYKIVNPVLLPPASKIFSMMVYLWSIGFLQSQIYSTLFQLTIAFILALVGGVIVGILVSYFAESFAFMESLLNAVRVVPAPAWLALSILWFGIGHASAIFIIWLGCFFPIFLNTVAGVGKVEPVQVESVRNFGGDNYDVLWYVLLPVAYPQILMGARIGLGIGWITVVTAELASADANAGLGWMISDSRILLDITTVMCAMVIIGTLGVITDSFLNRLDGLVKGWS